MIFQYATAFFNIKNEVEQLGRKTRKLKKIHQFRIQNYYTYLMSSNQGKFFYLSINVHCAY